VILEVGAKLLQRLALQAGDMHLRDVQSLGNLGLRSILEEAHPDDALCSFIQPFDQRLQGLSLFQGRVRGLDLSEDFRSQEAGLPLLGAQVQGGGLVDPLQLPRFEDALLTDAEVCVSSAMLGERPRSRSRGALRWPRVMPNSRNRRGTLTAQV
jgi:hypothetical protein